MGKVLILAAAVLPGISGALHRPAWIIPTCAALAVIGFFVTDPQAAYSDGCQPGIPTQSSR